MKTGLTNSPERALAKSRGEKFYWADKPCRNGHRSKRYTNSGACHECTNRDRSIARSADTLGEVENSIKSVVYVIEAGEYCKIGISEKVSTRMQVVKTHCPIPVRLAYCTEPMPRLNAVAIEDACFRELSEFWTHGEWYRCHPDKAVFLVKKLSPERAAPIIKSTPVQLTLVACT